MSELRPQVKRFAEFLAAQGFRLTRQRQAIAQAFFGSDKHLSLPEIQELAIVEQPGIGYATVYRTMRLLTEGGFATEHKFGENHALFEPKVEGEHHDHLICVDCGHIVEFEDDVIERRQDTVARDRGFEVVSHRHEVYVRCVRESCEHRQA